MKHSYYNRNIQEYVCELWTKIWNENVSSEMMSSPLWFIRQKILTYASNFKAVAKAIYRLYFLSREVCLQSVLDDVPFTSFDHCT